MALTGFIGLFVYALSTEDGATPKRMWWDVAAGTELVRAGRLSPTDIPPVDARTAAILGFRLTEEDVAANEAGRQSRRQRIRALTRAVAYSCGFPLGLALAIGMVLALVQKGFDLRLLFGLVAAPIIALASLAYAVDAWRDVASGLVLRIDGVPAKGVEDDSTEGGYKWRFPYLELHGQHKLSWRAFNAIQPGRRYRLYVLPASGRCVGAVPL